MSRERILAAVRTALARSAAPSIAHPLPPRGAAAASEWASLADQFRTRFEALGGKWHEATSGETIADVVGALVAPGLVALVSRDPAGRLEALRVGASLARRGVRVVAALAGVPRNEIAVTLTGVTAAIAESGTFGLLVAPGQGRLGSVIAPVHVAVVARSQIVPSLGEYLAQAREALAAGASSAGILVTGPSRTADIEGQLIVGVHGPGEVHAILIDG